MLPAVIQSTPREPLSFAATEIEPLLARSDGHHHLVQFYQDERHLFEVVGRFLADGLTKGQPGLVLATPGHCNGVRWWLEQNGVDLDGALASGRLLFLDARETLSKFIVLGKPEWASFQETISPIIQRLHALHPGAIVRAYGEMVDLLWRDGNPEGAIQLEEHWNRLGEVHSFALLCGYIMGNFTTGADVSGFQEVCRAHSHVIPSERSQTGTDDDRRRYISMLEQRAQALAHEIEHRRRVEKELLDAIRVREDFLSVAGHELKTPLTATQLQMDSLIAFAQRNGSEEVAARLGRIRKQTGRLGTLVEDLLDVSRLSAGRFRLELQQVDLAELVRDVAERFRETAERSGCTLRVLGENSVSGQWDRLRLEQVVTNLLSNALKYGAGKPVEVLAGRAKHRARLVVRDEGIGIPLKDQARVFQRFERAGPSKNYGGLGLGLWIARQLVEAHGGTLRVDSEPGEGATFTMELPL